jgi:pimeloyl-ACP methyl ester carboxylesterase
VRCPALVLIGGSDSMTPPKIGRALADKIAGSQTSVIPGSGHMMMYEAPDAMLDALIAFFRSK